MLLAALKIILLDDNIAKVLVAEENVATEVAHPDQLPGLVLQANHFRDLIAPLQFEIVNQNLQVLLDDEVPLDHIDELD